MKPAILTAEQWPESLAAIIEDMHGRPLNVHGLMAHNPELLKAWWAFRNHSVAGGTLGHRLAELAILRIAVRMETWYEWASHVVRGQSAGLEVVEIERVKLGGGAAGWSEAESLLLTAVDELLDQRRIGAATLAGLERHFEPPQIMDLMAITGMYFVLGCMVNTWGLELDARVAEALPEGIDEASFTRHGRAE